MGYNTSNSQWEIQYPKMEVLYHIRPYFVGIFPYIGLIYIYIYMVGTSNESVPEMAIEIWGIWPRESRSMSRPPSYYKSSVMQVPAHDSWALENGLGTSFFARFNLIYLCDPWKVLHQQVPNMLMPQAKPPVLEYSSDLEGQTPSS